MAIENIQTQLMRYRCHTSVGGPHKIGHSQAGQVWACVTLDSTFLAATRMGTSPKEQNEFIAFLSVQNSTETIGTQSA